MINGPIDQIKNAMLFAAGLGTRLRPLTNDRPKALVELKGVSLLERAIRKLKQAGIREIVVNVHHFADQIESFLSKNDNFGLEIHISDERDQLLETGGGLLKARTWLEKEAFLVMNTDVVSNINLANLMKTHLETGALATLAIRKRNTSRYLLFDESRQLVGWENIKTGEQKMSRSVASYEPYGFSGIHVMSPALFDYMPNELQKFSIIDTYLVAAKKEMIQGFEHNEDVWFDVGKPEQLRQAESVINDRMSN